MVLWSAITVVGYGCFYSCDDLLSFKQRIIPDFLIYTTQGIQNQVLLHRDRFGVVSDPGNPPVVLK